MAVAAGAEDSCPAGGCPPPVDEITDTQRKNLGSPDFTEDMVKNWKDADIAIDNDQLKIMGHPVMERWEEPYMERLARIATSNGGRVLELGFGMAISATFVQKSPRLKEHVIIDANAKIVERAKEWSKTTATSKVTVHHGFSWDVAPKLDDGSFDGILYDTYPLKNGAANRHHRDFFDDAKRLLRVGGKFTWFCNEDVAVSDEELKMLDERGFTCTHEQIDVPTPDDCQYWRAKTIVAPTCIKRR
jgi:guanidinoacetate N-methyltransferase